MNWALRGLFEHFLLRQWRNETKAPRISDKIGEEINEPSPVDGTWTGATTGLDGNPLDVTYVFEAAGPVLVETISARLGGGPFPEGTIDGNKISFVVRNDQFTINSTGTLAGDLIYLTNKVGDSSTHVPLKRMNPKR